MKRSFEVANVRCGGCANTITTKLTEAGFKEVEVDLACEPRKVTAVIENEVQEAHFKDLLTKLGYPLADAAFGRFETAGLKAKSIVSCAVGKFELNRKQ